MNYHYLKKGCRLKGLNADKLMNTFSNSREVGEDVEVVHVAFFVG